MDIDITDLMLHKKPMLLVDKILQATDKSVVTSFEIKSDNIFLNKKNVLSRTAQIEIMAQSLAALNAFGSNKNNEPTKKGFLVMLKNINFFNDAKCDDIVECNVDIVDFLAQTYIAKCKLVKQQDKTTLCEGEIRIYTFEN